MKRLLILSILGTGLLFSDVYVGGYYKSDGTYVAPHFRSNKDGNFYNNWSSIGNYNPYTGKKGYKRYHRKHQKSFFNLYD